MPGKGSHPSRGESRTPSSKPHSEHHGSTDRYRDHTKGTMTVAPHWACLFWARSVAAVNLGINTSLTFRSPVMRSWASHCASQFPPLKSSGGGVRAIHIRRTLREKEWTALREASGAPSALESDGCYHHHTPSSVGNRSLAPMLCDAGGTLIIPMKMA